MVGWGSLWSEYSFVGLASCSDWFLNQWELDSRVVELTDIVSSDVINFVHDTSSDDVDRVSNGSVTTAHVDVKLGDGAIEGEITVLFVDIVNGGSWLVSEYNAIGFK